MKKIRLKLFRLIKENESESDERVINERRRMQTLMFSVLRLIFCIIMLAETFNFFNVEIMYKILYYSFFSVMWIEPFIFSKYGLWEKVKEAKLLIETGCIISFLGITNILDKIVFPKNILTGFLNIAVGVFASVITYFIYAKTYYNYIRKQDAE